MLELARGLPWEMGRQRIVEKLRFQARQVRLHHLASQIRRHRDFRKLVRIEFRLGVAAELVLACEGRGAGMFRWWRVIGHCLTPLRRWNRRSLWDGALAALQTQLRSLSALRCLLQPSRWLAQCSPVSKPHGSSDAGAVEEPPNSRSACALQRSMALPEPPERLLSYSPRCSKAAAFAAEHSLSTPKCWRSSPARRTADRSESAPPRPR